jgi:hypothetical protein
MEEKKQWIKPQLIILGRGTPEEVVLAACKTGAIPVFGPDKTTCDAAPGPCHDNLSS